MAQLSLTADTPVAVLNDAEWLSVRALCLGGQIPQDRTASRLRRAGVLDDLGITRQAAPAFQGVPAATRHLEVARIEPAAPERLVEAWISPARTTVVKHERDGLHVYGLDACEVPSAFAELLDLGPRDNVDLGPHHLPAEITTLLDSGDVTALNAALSQLADTLDTGGEPGEPGGPTPLTEGFKHRTWSLSLISTRVLGLEGWQVADSLNTLSVPECLYDLQVEAPTSPPLAGLRAQEARGGAELVLEPISSIMAWGAVSPWFFPPLS